MLNLKTLLKTCLLLMLAWAPSALAQEACPDPAPNVEAVPTPTPTPSPKVWDKGDPIGTVLDTDGTPATDDSGNAITNGRMTAPQDQTGTERAPVKVRVGSLVPYGVEEAADPDHWLQKEVLQTDCSRQDQDGTAGDELTVKWTATGGEFVEKQGRPYWQAPTSPGVYRLTVTYDDKPTPVGEHEGGDRDDPPLASFCDVTVYALSVHFVDTVVAAGNVDDDAHHAKFEITASDGTHPVPDVGVDTPEIVEGGLGPDEAITASVHLTQSQTDANGVARGYLRSGHRTQDTKIKLDGDPGSVTQVWNELGEEAWSYTSYFEYDAESTVTYRMAYTQNAVQKMIAGHSLKFVNTKIEGWEWKSGAGDDLDGDGVPDGDYEHEVYSEDDEDSSGWENYESLSEWSSTSESSPGLYSATQTVWWSDFFAVDSITFNVEEGSVFDAN